MSEINLTIRDERPNVTISSPGPQGPAGSNGTNGDITPSNSSNWTGSVGTGVYLGGPVTYIRTLTGNVSLGSPIAASSTQAFTVTLVIKQAASGGPYTVTFPVALEWAGDALAPVMPATANAELVVHLFWTGAAWRAMYGGSFFP